MPRAAVSLVLILILPLIPLPLPLPPSPAAQYPPRASAAQDPPPAFATVVDHSFAAVRAASGGGAEPATPGERSVSGTWLWPTAGARFIHRAYAAPPRRYAAGHRGIDISTSGAVIAPADGAVHFAGVVVDRPVLSIMHSDGHLSSYEPVNTALRRGDAVQRGQVIGEVAPVGTGPPHCETLCLHVGVRINGEYVSPLLLFEGIPRSVLLPTRRFDG
ncbi:murein DD-endopeptidase MepM/ murein hydrolase activator NlpD [Glaciihabitans tibetensis]|uniref:Murein DD-endopeptidase MepM/ murein hydrolase activator NlpD n=1 Tax=Glaciihabitans tibetensis TaxID=1266600 RepID=A0A2T0VID6_9MICO|nr:peptidoglycan DD-metalloendopeptidase family protein [Glaciihabitans tibetensis]PRY69957.1 murein DD-endopeptidase MepM/ murein hydrolase activator NlpD [Glaciihabitans tibetensis]